MQRKILRLFLFCFSFVLRFLFGVKSYDLVKKELNQENNEEQVAQLVFRNKVDSYQKPTQWPWGSSGGSYSLSILGENVTNVSALSIDVFYEPEAVNVYTVRNLLSLDSTSIFDSKIDNTNGVIHISYAFLENQEINDIYVFAFDFHILDSAKANSYFSMAIVSACDEEGNNVEIQSDFSYFTIKDSAIVDSVASIYVFSIDLAKQNDVVTLSYNCFTDLGAGTFELTYDREAFELLKFQKGSFLDKSTMYTAINTSVAGKLSISFASMDTNPEYINPDLFSIQFKVKTNSDNQWDFILDSFGLTSKDGLTKYKAPSLVKRIQTVYEQDTSLLPLMYLTADVDETNKKVDVTLSMEANSHLSAADIEIDFDTSLFSYDSYQSKVSLTDEYLLGVNDKKKSEGILKLSWVYMNDLTQKVDFAKFTFDILDVYVDSTPTFTLKATGTRNQNLKSVDLAYQSASVSLTINKHEWSDWSVTNSPTCTEDGIESRSCNYCHRVELKKVEKYGHDFVRTETPATCTEDGKIEYICSRCGKHDTSREDVLPAKGHSYGEWIIDTEPTCAKNGTRHRVCSECGQCQDESVPALGHDFVRTETTATCTEDGKIEYICSRCGKHDTSREEVLPAKGHFYGKWIIDTKPTCTENGTRHRVCSECGHTDTDIISALGHDFVFCDGKEPTCTEIGWNSYETCSRCGYTTYVEITALGHDYIKMETPATCTEEGKIEYICSRCGKHDTSREEVLPAKGHFYGKWIIDTKPTCTENGTRHRVCSECGQCQDESIPALGHDFVRTETPATCTKDGKIEYICSRCGKHDTSREEVLPAKGHSYGEWITEKEATTKEEGLMSRTCSVCGDVEAKIISKLEKKTNILAIAFSTAGVTITGISIFIVLFLKKRKKQS